MGQTESASRRQPAAEGVKPNPFQHAHHCSRCAGSAEVLSCKTCFSALCKFCRRQDPKLDHTTALLHYGQCAQCLPQARAPNSEDTYRHLKICHNLQLPERLRVELVQRRIYHELIQPELQLGLIQRTSRRILRDQVLPELRQSTLDPEAVLVEQEHLASTVSDCLP